MHRSRDSCGQAGMVNLAVSFTLIYNFCAYLAGFGFYAIECGVCKCKRGPWCIVSWLLFRRHVVGMPGKP